MDILNSKDSEILSLKYLYDQRILSGLDRIIDRAFTASLRRVDGHRMAPSNTASLERTELHGEVFQDIWTYFRESPTGRLVHSPFSGDPQAVGAL